MQKVLLNLTFGSCGITVLMRMCNNVQQRPVITMSSIVYTWHYSSAVGDTAQKSSKHEAFHCESSHAFVFCFLEPKVLSAYWSVSMREMTGYHT